MLRDLQLEEIGDTHAGEDCLQDIAPLAEDEWPLHHHWNLMPASSSVGNSLVGRLTTGRFTANPASWLAAAKAAVN
jgi:hypothetical protein